MGLRAVALPWEEHGCICLIASSCNTSAFPHPVQTLWLGRLPPPLASHLRASGTASTVPLHVLYCRLYHTNLLQARAAGNVGACAGLRSAPCMRTSLQPRGLAQGHASPQPQNPELTLEGQMEARRSAGGDVPGRAKTPWQAVGAGWQWGERALEGLTTVPGERVPRAPPPLPPYSSQV